MLEIPPRAWKEPQPLPPWAQRLRDIGLFSYLGGFLFFLVSALVGGPDLPARLVGGAGLSIYLASLLVRVTLALRIALRARRNGSSR